jgi:hypothetical protein
MNDLIQQGVTRLPVSGITELIIGAFVAGAAAYIWYRFKKIEEKVERAMNKGDVVELVDYKLAPITTEQVGIKEDIKKLDTKIDDNQARVEKKLDKLIDKLLT